MVGRWIARFQLGDRHRFGLRDRTGQQAVVAPDGRPSRRLRRGARSLSSASFTGASLEAEHDGAVQEQQVAVLDLDEFVPDRRTGTEMRARPLKSRTQNLPPCARELELLRQDARQHEPRAWDRCRWSSVQRRRSLWPASRT